MKKLLTIVLSLVMVLSMTAVSFAGVTTNEDGTLTIVDDSTVTVTKTYKLDGAGKSPKEAFGFSALECVSVADAGVGVTTTNAPVPTISTVDFAAGAATTGGATATATIILPTYDAVGVYTYAFTETDNGTAGVTYHSGTIKLVVTVVQGEDGLLRVAAIHTETEGAKSDVFTNTYKANSLTVGKQVTGLFGDRDKDFSFTVKFTAPAEDTVREAITVGGKEVIAAGWDGSAEYTFTLAHNEDITFDNIPAGVQYEVVEASYAADGYEAAQYDGNEKGTMDNTAISTVVTNEKKGDIDTGIILDNGLYIVLLAGVAVVAGAFFMKRRQDDYDM